MLLCGECGMCKIVWKYWNVGMKAMDQYFNLLFVCFFYRFDRKWKFRYACSLPARWMWNDSLLFILYTSLCIWFSNCYLSVILFLYVFLYFVILWDKKVIGKATVYSPTCELILWGFLRLELYNNSIKQRNCH